jgi:hypothetical protein
MVEEPMLLNTPCTKFDFSKIEDDYLITFAIAQMEGAAEEAQKRGLGYLLPKVAR